MMTYPSAIGPLWVRALAGGIALLAAALIIAGVSASASSPRSDASMILAMETISGVLGIGLIAYGALLVAKAQRRRE